MPETEAQYLIADPAPHATHRVRRLLQAEGVAPEAIHEAYTAQEALRLFRERSPDVVFLSLDLPDGDVVEVAELLWAEDDDVDLVATTARQEHDPRVLEVLEVGAHSLLRKPVRRETVADLLAALAADGDDRDEADAHHLTRIPPPA